MNRIFQIRRFVALALLAGTVFVARPIAAHAEGDGGGGKVLPPPKLIVSTPDYKIYDNGLIIYADGHTGHVG